MTTAFLRVENLFQIIGTTTLLKGVSLQLTPGKIVALLGPNGAGKTTLLKTIIGLYKTPHAQPATLKNCIMIDNQLINALPVHQRVEKGLLYLPQHTSLFQQLSVEANLNLIYDYQPYWQHNDIKEFLEERDELLEQTSLTHTLTQAAETLSGGQKRKLEIIRSLLMHPKAIMLDEPFAGVDPKSIYELKKIFTSIAEQNIALLISDHHVDQLLSIAHYGYVMLQGQIVTSGSTKEILEHHLTQENYLGAHFYHEITQRLV